MFLVIVGREQYQFNALMQWLEILIQYRIINEDVIVQYGSSSYVPDGARAYRYLNDSDFLKLVDNASLIISHCDENIAQFLEDRDTPYVLVPRLQRFREYADNHQMDVADEFENRGIAIARSPGDIVKFLKLQQTSEVIPNVNEANLCDYLSKRYPQELFPKLMLVCAAGGAFRYMQSLVDFWGKCSDRVWIAGKNSITEQEIFWWHSNTFLSENQV
jgi:UDP-N-acetylglucosamine transferase subunit ALG13